MNLAAMVWLIGNASTREQREEFAARILQHLETTLHSPLFLYPDIRHFALMALKDDTLILDPLFCMVRILRSCPVVLHVLHLKRIHL